MARVTIERSSYEAFIRREFMARARRAIALYRKAPLKRDAPGYPFAQRAEDGGIRRARSATIRPTARGVRITVQSRGAPFIEGGNDDAGAFIEGNLNLPLRRRKGPGIGGAKRSKGGRVIIGADGRPYLAVQRVRTYRGRQLLLQATARAFTGSPIGGGPARRR